MTFHQTTTNLASANSWQHWLPTHDIEAAITADAVRRTNPENWRCRNIPQHNFMTCWTSHNFSTQNPTVYKPHRTQGRPAVLFFISVWLLHRGIWQHQSLQRCHRCPLSYLPAFTIKQITGRTMPQPATLLPGINDNQISKTQPLVVIANSSSKVQLHHKII